MKFTVTFITLLSISSSWAVLAKPEEPKDKREAPTSYPSSAGYSSNYQTPLSHSDANAFSVGAGYSIGGAKPAYNFDGHASDAGLQQSFGNLQSGHGGTIQLAPITLQPNQDLSQLMSQITKSLGSGALAFQPSNTIAEFHTSGQGGQEYSFPQFQQYIAPKIQQQYALAGQISSEPSYAAGTKGLSSYSTGPVLFNPSQEQVGQKQAAFGYVAPSVAHSSDNAGSSAISGSHSLAGLSLGSAGHSLGGSGLSLGGSGHSLAGLGAAGLSFDNSGYALGGAGSLGSSGHSLGGSGYSFGSPANLVYSQGGSGHSLGAPGALGHSYEGSSISGPSLGGSPVSEHSLGSSAPGGSAFSYGSSGSPPSKHYKVLSSSGISGSSKTAFKPSTFLGASIPSESGSSVSHGASFPSFSGSSLGGSHSALSFSGHGPSYSSFGGFGGSSKAISPLYTKFEGSSLDSAGAYSSAGNLASTPGANYGFPTASYPAGAVQAASSSGPQYYLSSSKYPSSFGGGSLSYRSPSSAHSSLSSHSSGPKYSFSGRSLGSRYLSPKDSHGDYSDTSYNTIKYSEELKPRVH